MRDRLMLKVFLGFLILGVGVLALAKFTAWLIP